MLVIYFRHMKMRWNPLDRTMSFYSNPCKGLSRIADFPSSA